MTNEVLSSYTEDGGDVDDIFTQTASRSTWTACERQTEVYLYDDKEVDHFGDFEHLLVVCLTDIAGGATVRYVLLAWALANHIGDWRDLLGSLVAAIRNKSSDDTKYTVSLKEQGNGSDNGTYEYSLDTPYYWVIARTDTTFTLDVYSDAAMSALNLLESLSVEVTSDPFQYIYAPCSIGAISGNLDYVTSGYVENLNLQEVVEVAPAPTKTLLTLTL